MNRLISDYRQLTIQRWDCLSSGKNIEKANRKFLKAKALFKKIVQDNLLSEFVSLLSDPNDAVALDAASTLLKNKIYVDESIKVLKRISMLRGALGFDAEMCLKYLS